MPEGTRGGQTADHADRDNGPYENRENRSAKNSSRRVPAETVGSERSERPETMVICQ